MIDSEIEIKSAESNENGAIRAILQPWGAGIISLFVPDRFGNEENIILSYPKATDYKSDPYYLGCVVGRYSGRVTNGNQNGDQKMEWFIDGKKYSLKKNEHGINHLHGGEIGWNKKLWETTQVDSSSVTFNLVSPAGDEGYPGQVKASVQYKVMQNEFHIYFNAKSTEDTLLRLTQHAYFNFAPVDELELTLFARAKLERDAQNIPTGERTEVKSPVSLKLKGCVLDDSFVIQENESHLRQSAILTHPRTGRSVTVFSTDASLHVYTGDGLSDPFVPRTGIALESQPLPREILKKGQVYQSHTIWKFNG